MSYDPEDHVDLDAVSTETLRQELARRVASTFLEDRDGGERTGLKTMGRDAQLEVVSDFLTETWYDEFRDAVHVEMLDQL